MTDPNQISIFKKSADKLFSEFIDFLRKYPIHGIEFSHTELPINENHNEFWIVGFVLQNNNITRIICTNKIPGYNINKWYWIIQPCSTYHSFFSCIETITQETDELSMEIFINIIKKIKYHPYEVWNI